MMYRLWDTQLFLYLNPKFGMGTNNVGVKDSAQLEEEQQLIFGRPGTILVCGKCGQSPPVGVGTR